MAENDGKNAGNNEHADIENTLHDKEAQLFDDITVLSRSQENIYGIFNQE